MSIELYDWRECSFNPTFDVRSMTVCCPCGCGSLTAIPFRGQLQAHVWPDQIRFTFKSRIVQFLASVFLFRLKPPKALLVLVEFTNGTRLQCAPSKLHRGKGGDFATDRPCAWKEILQTLPDPSHTPSGDDRLHQT